MKGCYSGLLCVAVLSSCLLSLAPVCAADKAELPYVHAVIFHLKKDAPQDAIAGLIEDCHGILGKINSVRHLSVGRPAEKATPKYAKSDYSVGLLVIFDNAEGLYQYLNDQEHQKFLDKHAKYWDVVHVYDFVNQKK
jgi:hypothetical protein